MPTLDSLPPPARSFASDNSAGVHPSVMAALVGGQRRPRPRLRRRPLDRRRPWPASATCSACRLRGAARVGRHRRQRRGAGHDARPAQAVVCTEGAHINVDETRRARAHHSAPSSSTCPTEDGKLAPRAGGGPRARARRRAPRPARRRVDHPVDRAAARSTRPTRSPRCADVAHRHGMTVHIDGARIANAAVGARRCDVRSFTVDVGVDVISFGGTKNGMMYGEAVVFLDPALGPMRPASCASRSPSCRRRCASSPPSSRRCSPTTSGCATPAHANAMARRLAERVARRPRRRARRAAGGQQPVPPCPRTPSSRCRRGRSSGTGTRPPAGAVDDELRHHRGRRRALRRRRACRARLDAPDGYRRRAHRRPTGATPMRGQGEHREPSPGRDRGGQHQPGHGGSGAAPARPGQTVLGHELLIVPGGKGLNQAVAAARSGASTAFVGMVGQDSAGTHLLAVLSTRASTPAASAAAFTGRA